MSTADRPPSSISIEGLPISPMTLRQSLERAIVLADRGLVKIGWLNAHCANLRRSDDRYAEACRRFDLFMNDGVGLDIAARLQGRSFPANLNGTDWIPHLLDHLDSINSRYRRIFLLGATTKSLTQAQAAIERRWANVQVVGSHDGYFETTLAPLSAIRKASPDLLLVGMGVPRQELFIVDHEDALLQSGVRIAIAGGAILDFLGGTVVRAPSVIQAVKLEWAWRLLLEPGRLWRRYVVGNPQFLFYAYQHSRALRRRK